MNYGDRSKDQKVHEYDMNKAIKIKKKKIRIKRAQINCQE